MAAPSTVSSTAYYCEYHGHRIEHLRAVHAALREGRDGRRCPIVWLAGDSSLDNKAWLDEYVDAVGGLERVIQPPVSAPDVAHQLAVELARRGLGEEIGVINCAVEESTLHMRGAGASLTPQDAFLRDNLEERDVVVVSVGGNDVALRPTPATIASMGALVCCATRALLRSGMALGLGHFRRMYQADGAGYIAALTSRCKPVCVAVCTIYFPDEVPGGSWAGPVLASLGYDRHPAHLQEIIRAIHLQGTSRVAVEGVPIVPVALFDALDGTRHSDYVARVEPSASGGARIATLLVDVLQPYLGPVRQRE